MDALAAKPVHVTGPAALLWGIQFASDPLMATWRMFHQRGP